VSAQEKMKEDFEKDNSKWKFAAGKWERRKSGDSMVLAQTAETQPWAVAILEDKKYSEVDANGALPPRLGKEDASAASSSERKTERTTSSCEPMGSRTTSGFIR